MLNGGNTFISLKAGRLLNPSTAGQLVKGVCNYLVLDFEATCIKGAHIQPQEIIEFPVLLLKGEDLHEADRFHRYVRPVHHPYLSSFCTQVRHWD